MNKTLRNECLLLCGILLLAGIGYGLISYRQTQSTRDAQAVILVDGKEVGRYPLNEDCQIPIQGVNGGKNTLQIKNGTAKITKASCPDGICYKHRAIKKNGQTIVCLPNKVVIEIQSGDEADVDGSTN
ncbi:NusG domain II [Lachnospiraceae bacterium XBB1006]|nr:NusG domain II [Lachnospiraceae bacterium XBB1006]